MNRLKQIDEEIIKLEKEKSAILTNQTPEETAISRFLNSYNGTELLKKHTLEEYGLWDIRGEDPNCDLGGSHHMPHLGTVEGKLIDVIEHAVSLNSFYTWGGGGDITKTLPQKIHKVTKL